MELVELIELLEKEKEERKKILINKNRDYSSMNDVLSNFNQVAALSRLTPERVIFTLMGIKMERMANLIGKGYGSVNESLADSITDLQNYALLLRASLEETTKREGITKMEETTKGEETGMNIEYPIDSPIPSSDRQGVY